MIATRRIPFLLLFALGTLALQLPFVWADPDRNVSESRGAHTDEGLYAGQVRNAIHHGDRSLYASDNLIKTPLFGAMLYGSFRVFGATLAVGRLTVMLLTLAVFVYLYNQNAHMRKVGLLSFISIITNYYIFHHFHYSLAEVLSSALILLSVYWLARDQARTLARSRVVWSSFVVATAISAAYCLKIQFVYAVAVPLLILLIFRYLPGQDKGVLLRKTLFTALFLAGYLLLYGLCWYWPHHVFYDYVMADQTTDRFATLPRLAWQIGSVAYHKFLNPYMLVYSLSFCFLMYVVVKYFIKNLAKEFGLYVTGLLCWLLVELHKVPMTYLPTRYLVSVYVAMGALIALVAAEILYVHGQKLPNVRRVTVALVALMVLKNGYDYATSLSDRTYQIQAINQYLAQYDFHGQPVMGAWAPSLTWDSKAISHPIWKNYFNDINVINTYNPAMIIAEEDENDSNEAFLTQGIDLDACADSSRAFVINRWHVRLYWMKNAHHTNRSTPH